MSEHEARHQLIEFTASEILHAALDDDTDAVVEMLSVLRVQDSEECPAIARALAHWADALREHLFDGLHGGAVLTGSASMVRPEDGAEFALGSAEADMAVPPRYLWACAMISARFQCDAARYRRLWDEAPDDPTEFGKHVLAVLYTCARTIKGTPRGSACDCKGKGAAR